MIKKNIVRVETLDRMGTGLLYPCRREDEKGYIVFTNKHILEDVPDVENIQEYVQIVIYDDFGKEIADSKMKNWDWYRNGSSLDYQDDVAAIYFEMDEDVVFHLETAVELNELDNRTNVYMEGYPGVMSNDDIDRRIQLEGVSKTLFPNNKEIGAYQITDDYHWYNNYSDYKVLAGISGSPVYYINQGKIFILGINQSVANIDQGENPFKLVYYIKFKHILDYLRQEDCIIFSMISECEFQILWVKGKKRSDNNEIKLLLIGGSGSGKSSFVNSFAYHQGKIRSVGDGQTTRTDVVYSFSPINEDPNATVFFLTSNEFVNNMFSHIGAQPILLTIAQALGIPDKVVEDEKKFLLLLHRIYGQLVRFEDEKNDKVEFDKQKRNDCKKVQRVINDLMFQDVTGRNKIMMYEDILDHIFKIVPYYFMPCLFDEGWRNERAMVRNSMGLSEEDVLGFFYIPKTANVEYNQVWMRLARKVYDILLKNEKNHFDTLQKDLVSFFYDIYLGRYVDKGFLDKKEEVLVFGRDELISYKMPHLLYMNSHEESQRRLMNTQFQNKLFDSIVSAKGFFDIKEFDFLIEGNWKDDVPECKLLVEFEMTNDEDDDENINSKKKREKKDIVISKNIAAAYRGIYKKIMEAIEKQYPNYYNKPESNNGTDNRTTLSFKLNDMNEMDIMTLQKCLKVTREGSFTGIIQSVAIKDKISDLYAVILDKLEIDMLTIVDTCGLDHVTIWNEKDLEKQVARLYADYVKKWERSEENQHKWMMETGILYIKKLDSGKPDELNSILPIVRKIIPATPIYCMFSGIDIFYRTDPEINNIFWKKNSTNCPKAVRYILETDMNMHDIADENALKVLRNNLIPFCGDEKLVYTKFAYYRNNVSAVRKLLTSIAMKESSSLEIVDQSFIDDIEEGNYDEIIEEILERMFEVASLHSKSVWWNTQKADIKSFVKDRVMGFERTYNHMLYYLFHVGYVTAIREKGGKLLKKPNESVNEVKYEKAVIASLYNMENLFLGINNNLIKVELDESKKNKFRLILEEIYKENQHNPLSTAYKECLTEEYIKDNREKIFDEVFNFKSKINNPIIRSKLIEFFKKQFLKQIEIDNNHKVTYLVKMNESFVEELAKVRKDFYEKYGDKDGEKTDLFDTFMRYYFTLSNKNDGKINSGN